MDLHRLLSRRSRHRFRYILLLQLDSLQRFHRYNRYCQLHNLEAVYMPELILKDYHKYHHQHLHRMSTIHLHLLTRRNHHR